MFPITVLKMTERERVSETEKACFSKEMFRVREEGRSRVSEKDKERERV